MKKFLIFTAALLLVISLTGISCSQKAAEKAAEESLEKSTNGEADVDIDDDSIKINTNEGTFEAGEEVDLPEGFPSDVYVVDGTIKSATSTNDESYSVSIETSKSVTAVKDEYEGQLEDDGWEITSTYSFEGGSMLGAEKGNRIVTVTINNDTDNENTFVVLVVSKTE